MWSLTRPLILATLLLPVCHGMAQQGTDAVISVPEKAVLQSRLKEFWRAVGAHDLAKRYAMTTPTVRQLVSFQEFRKTWSWEEASNLGTQEITAELSRVCGCTHLRFLRCTLELALTFEQGEQRHKHTVQAWEFADGQWYEAYSGAPYRSRCP